MTENLIKVVLYAEQGKTIAQCLDKDIGVQADGASTAIINLVAQIFLELSIWDTIKPAPQKFFDMWESGHNLSAVSKLPINIPPMDIRIGRVAQ